MRENIDRADCPMPKWLQFVCGWMFLLCQALANGYGQVSSSATGLPSDLTFEQIFLDQGLSQSIVKCICQDQTGFMWFGTEDGLNKYDGYQFTVIRHDPQDSNSLGYNHITALRQDRSGLIWIGTFYGGLNTFNPRTQEFFLYQNDPNDPGSLSHNNVNVIFEDRSGNLWVGTDAGLNRIAPGDPVTFIRFQQDARNPNSLSHNTVRAICQDSSGTLWIGTDGGLNRLVPSQSDDPDQAHFIRYQHESGNPNSLSHNSVYALCADQESRLWIGTNGGGLNRLEPGKNNFKSYRHQEKNPHSLSYDQVYALMLDRNGLLWIGTNGGGLNILDPDREEFIVYRNDPYNSSTLSYDEIRALYQDRSGLIWIGTYGAGLDKVDLSRRQFTLYTPDLQTDNGLSQPIVWSIYEDSTGLLWIGSHGGGLDRFDRKTNQWRHYRHDPGNPYSLSHDIVRVIFADRAGRFWIGTHGGGINLFDRRTGRFNRYVHDPEDPSSLSQNEIRSIYQDRAGGLWIGTFGGGLNKMVPAEKPGMAPSFIRYRNNPDDPNSLSNDFVRVMSEDRSGQFWLGTEGGGLEKMDRETGRFRHYRSEPDDPNSLNNDYIFAIHEDRDGFLWLGTWGGGLNKYDCTTDQFSHYTEADGLPNDAIYAILEDDTGNLWLSTNNGLSRFNPKTEQFKNYTVEDGLQSNEFNGGSAFKSRSGELFFGGIAGFNAFFPDQIKENPFIPPVVITDFYQLNKKMQFDQPLSELKTLQLSYRDYVFSFEFAALDYTAPEKNQYAYKMEGLDADWLYTSAKKRFVTYTTLAPGKYTFRVKGSNNDGIWNEAGAAIPILITPPLWQTWWARLLAVLLILGLFYILFRRRLKNVRFKTELRAAHEAQMSIMPQADPQVPGFDISGICLPANTVGGDFFDYFWLDADHNRFGIAIGDVSGKAMQSAMTAVMTNGMIYARVANESVTVPELMTRLNRPMFLKTERNMFVALCLAAFDLRTRELAFTNAGLIEPLHKSADGIHFLETVGPKHPLGLLEKVQYQEQKIRLKSGDIIVFITDGIPEAQNSGREMYGDERIKHFLQNLPTDGLTARAIKDGIIEDVRRFSGRAAQHDDMTVVVVKCLPANQ